ncbi:hypothetical protein [Cohnella soli]|uniref:Uncharacterized protein n=1 Tax=Cohnella soli TaxID=425005 RepID=A0ABW0HMN6_9BACL
MFERIDFSPGIITYNETHNQNYMHEEDLFQVSYNQDMYVLDLGWYGNEYALMLIEQLNWSNPIWEKRTSEVLELEPIMLECVDYIKEKLLR